MSNLPKVIFSAFLCASLFSNAHALNKKVISVNDESVNASISKAPMPFVNKKISINLNQASAKDIAQFKGIGPKRSQAIVEYRNAHGVFKKLEDLSLVKGISKRFVEKNHAQLKATFVM